MSLVNDVRTGCVPMGSARSLKVRLEFHLKSLLDSQTIIQPVHLPSTYYFTTHSSFASQNNPNDHAVPKNLMQMFGSTVHRGSGQSEAMRWEVVQVEDEHSTIGRGEEML